MHLLSPIGSSPNLNSRFDGLIMAEISFEDWVKGRFDHPAGLEPWYYDHHACPADPSAEVSLKYLSRLFSESGELLKKYSDRQVNEGLWYLLSPASSNEALSLIDTALPLSERVKGVASIYRLYADCFFVRCSVKLSHLGKERDHSVNSICYMLWDVLSLPAFGGKTERKEIDAACLSVMAEALSLPHDACRESALHGLGHAKVYYPAEVERIIDAFLKEARDIGPELLRYARAARAGAVQ